MGVLCYDFFKEVLKTRVPKFFCKYIAKITNLLLTNKEIYDKI